MLDCPGECSHSSNKEYKNIFHPSLVRFEKNTDDEIIKEKCIKVIKAKNYNDLILNVDYNEIQNKLFFFKQDIKYLNEEIEDEREFICPWWFARHGYIKT